MSSPALIETLSVDEIWTLLDEATLGMPNVSGLEVFDGLRRHAPELPVVLSSGFSEDDIGPRLDAHTIFLRKPYAARESRRTVQAFLLAHQRGA